LRAKFVQIEAFIQYRPGFLNGAAGAAADSGQVPVPAGDEVRFAPGG
jgi:hypothetical protein